MPPRDLDDRYEEATLPPAPMPKVPISDAHARRDSYVKAVRDTKRRTLAWGGHTVETLRLCKLLPKSRFTAVEHALLVRTMNGINEAEKRQGVYQVPAEDRKALAVIRKEVLAVAHEKHLGLLEDEVRRVELETGTDTWADGAPGEEEFTGAREV